MSQLRLNPLTGRWITMVAGRAERPTDFAPRVRQVEADPQRACPFCPGHEEESLPPLLTYGEPGHWDMRVVPNKYPAFTGDEPLTVSTRGPVWIEADASGAHEVLVFAREHEASVADLDDRAAGRLLLAIRDRMQAHRAQSNLRYTQAVVNHGREAGASLSHPHAQLLGMPFVPGEILDEEAGFARFEGGCLMCTTAEAEANAGVRVVLETSSFVVVCPFWSGTPFELLVIPKTCEGHLVRAGEADVAAAGVAVRDALRLLRSCLGDVAYNTILHTAPHHHDRGFHWHLHIWPKLVTAAGFERGTGVMINIVPPEMAAATLRP